MRTRKIHKISGARLDEMSSDKAAELASLNRKRFSVEFSNEPTSPAHQGIDWGTNKEQLGNNKGTDQGTNKEQLGNNKGTNDGPSTDLKKQLGNNKGTDQGTNKEQLGNNKGTDQGTEKLLGQQVGHQLNILKLVFLSMMRSPKNISIKFSNEYISAYLSNACGHSVSGDTVRTSIKRLRRLGLLEIVESKRGNGGWGVYTIPVGLRPKMYELGNDQGTIKEQLGDPWGNNKGTDQGTTTLSSSSYINNIYKETTTTATNSTDEEINSLSPEWRFIDYAPLNEQNCPFGLSQIKQARACGMTPEVLQESIYHFAWALEKNWQPDGGFQTSPLNFFMGCLKKTGLFEYEGYYRQKKARQEREQIWLERCQKEKEAQTSTSSFEIDASIGRDPEKENLAQN